MQKGINNPERDKVIGKNTKWATLESGYKE